MKYKTLFRLCLKLLGVYLFFTNIDSVLTFMVATADIRSRGPSSSRFFLSTLIPLVYQSGGIVEFVLGFYLFFGGKWIVDKAIPGNRPYCQECAYDLTGAANNRCAECGTPFKRENIGAVAVDDSNVESE
jgi:hypothetical protein